jgi:putative solute:sodium symporter small subunit
LWTIALTGAVLLTTFALIFAVPLYSDELNGYSLLRFPAGFFLAAHGALIGMVVAIFWYSGRQEMIDRKFGAAEDS